MQTSREFFDNQMNVEILSVRELATRLGITESGVYKLVYREEIPCLKVGRLLRFDWGDVLASFGRQ